MKIDWRGIGRDIATLRPAAVGRLMRMALYVGGTAILGKGITGQKADHIIALIEIATGGIAWIVAYVLSHTSDEAVKDAAAAAPMSEKDLDRLIAQVMADQPTNLAGRPDTPEVPKFVLPPNYVPPRRFGDAPNPADANDSYRPPTPPSAPPAGGEG